MVKSFMGLVSCVTERMTGEYPHISHSIFYINEFDVGGNPQNNAAFESPWPSAQSCEERERRTRFGAI